VSCETNSTSVASRAAPKNGISRTGSKNGYAAGSTPQVSFFVIAGDAANGRNGKSAPQPAGRKTTAAAGPRRVKSGKQTGRRKRRKAQKRGASGPQKKTSARVSFFQTDPASAETAKQLQPASVPKAKTSGGTSTRCRIILGKDFSPKEMGKLSVQLRLGLAAATRHLRALDRGASRDTGHGDPRPADWARLDRRQFEFLTNQVSKARRARGRGKQGYLDLSSLKRGELVELWEFLRFEADRALRNVDHLQTPGSGIGGAAADYLAHNHKLEARFYTHLANQIEAIFPAENIQAKYPTGTGGS
jgi:hypothetical protein